MNRRQFSEMLVLSLGASAFRSLHAGPQRNNEMGNASKIEKVRLKLVPTSVPEWDKEDEMSGVLGGDELHKANDAQAMAILDQISLELPTALNWVELVRYAQQHQALGALQIPPNNNFSYYVIETPLTIVVPGDQRLVRLRLILSLNAEHASPGEVLAYDVFPPNQVDVKKLATGEVNLDVSKALQFALTSVGAPQAAPVADCLGIKLNLPFQWTSTSINLQSSGKMSSRVQWYVTDDAIQNGFAPAAILRAPRGATVTVDATMAGELRFRGPRGWFQTQFAPNQSHHYILK